MLAAVAAAQTLITGDITGTVTDPTGADVPGATVALKSVDSGSAQTATTSGSGAYRFSLLKPGRYTITVSQPGFRTAELQTDVAVGQVSELNLSLTLGPAAQTVEVTDVTALLNTEASNNTLFSPVEIQLLPSAGGDITNIAFTTPGVVVNVNNSYGNFTANGLPATSNLFTVNGENYMDPYFNVNNSGATNLTLGQNELQEATIITNPYSGAYGTFSGAQVTYVTKSGTNEFHGSAQYWWNGRYMNANDWFNNFYGEDRPFSNANQWAASFGGPIRKNTTFFFADTEGLRFVLPNVVSVTAPTPAFASAVLNNIQAVQPSEYNAYKTMLNLWDSAPGIGSAAPIPNPSSCNTVVLPGYNPATTPCAEKFNSIPTALASEWILSIRIDQKIGDHDNAFFRYRLDRGTQPTYLDPINPAFNAISRQPQWDVQFQETHVFGPRSTNSFTAALSHYVAQFQQDYQLASRTFPYAITTSGTVPFTTSAFNPGFNPIYDFPQGRNITQYQFIDDFTLIRGAHSLKFGANFRRYDVSDHNFYYNSPRVYFGYVASGLQQFVNGLAYQYRQSLNFASDVPVALWGLGFYANDDWRIKSNFKLTLALRAERNSNPVCRFDCWANFKGPWNTLASVTSSDPGSVPYSSDIAYNLHQAFPGVDALDLSPRIGFSWSPGKSGKTVISGGYGIFYDPFPAGVVDDLLADPPVSVALRVRPWAYPRLPGGWRASLRFQSRLRVRPASWPICAPQRTSF
jgi:hypothetical protein